MHCAVTSKDHIQYNDHTRTVSTAEQIINMGKNIIQDLICVCVSLV